MNKSISYEGKQVNIGIDVHKNSYAVAVISEGVKVIKCTIPATHQHLIGFIQTRFNGAHVRTVYEASFSGFGLHRALVAAGIENIVINPASVEVNARNRVKTDKLDALKMAEQLSNKKLRCINIPSEAQECRRLLSRTREQLVNARKRYIAQIGMKLFEFDLYPKHVSRLTAKHVKEIIKDESIFSELKIAINSLLSQHEHISQEIKEIERHLKEQTQNDKNEKLYRSIPGVGFIAGRILSNELGNLSQFSSAKKLSSFVGLTPTEHSSGDNIRRGHISRQGSARLRSILNQVSWVAIKRDISLKRYYDRLKIRCGGKRAIVAVSHKLLCRMLHMFKFQEEYKFAC